MSQVEDSGPVD